jgi:outer membrane protein assembly factor BamB
VVSETLVCVHSRQGEDEVVGCYDRASGQMRWSARSASVFKKNSAATRMAPGPFATPLLHQGALYTFSVNGELTAYDAASGRVRWRRSPQRPPNTSSQFCGTAVPPFADSGRLVVYRGDDIQGGEALAFHPADGRPLWSVRTGGPGYASFLAVTLDGVRQYVTLTDASVLALDAATGAVLWQHPFADQWHENIVTPVAAGGHIVVSGVRLGTKALKPVRAGGKWTVAEVWASQETAMYMASPIAEGDYVYGLSSRNRGQLFCQDARTGKLLWRSEPRLAEHASLAAVGPDLLVSAVEGRAFVFARSPARLELKARFELSPKGAVYAQPALAGRHIYVKDESALRALSLP